MSGHAQTPELGHGENHTLNIGIFGSVKRSDGSNRSGNLRSTTRPEYTTKNIKRMDGSFTATDTVFTGATRIVVQFLDRVARKRGRHGRTSAIPRGDSRKVAPGGRGFSTMGHTLRDRQRVINPLGRDTRRDLRS